MPRSRVLIDPCFLAGTAAVASGGRVPFVPLSLVNGRPADGSRLESGIERGREGRS